MFNPQIVRDLLKTRNIQASALIQHLNLSPNTSLTVVLRGNIGVDKLEKIADFFGVPTDTFFDRMIPSTGGVTVNGVKNRVHHFSVGSDSFDTRNTTQSLIDEKDRVIEQKDLLLEEKSKRITTLEEMIELLKKQNPSA